MNEKKCDEEIFQDHRDQELAAAATQTTQIQNTGLLYAPHGLRLSPAQKFKNIIHSSERSVFTFHGDAVRVTTNPWRHRQSRGEKCIWIDSWFECDGFYPYAFFKWETSEWSSDQVFKSESGGCWKWGCFGTSGERDYESCKETNLIATVAHVRV